MSTTNGIAVRQDLLPSRDALQTMLTLADQFVQSGLLPKEIDTAQKALVVIQKGVELGIPPMAALNGIAVIHGKPACSAELMLALVRRDHGGRAMRVKETTNDACTVEWREDGWDGTQTYTFAQEDAKRAGLTGGNWAKYPAAMLRARCISAVARMAFPESIAGMYLPDEVGGVPAPADVIDIEMRQPVPIETTVVTEQPTEDVIDAEPETGEIRNVRHRSDVATPPTPRPTDATGNDAPAPVQRETKASDDKRTKALRGLHAAGNDFVPPGEQGGLSHDDLGAVAELRYGVDSLGALVAADLDRLTTWLNGIHPSGRKLYVGWFADMIRAGDAIDQALASEVVRKLRDEWKSAGVSDPMLWECWRRTVATLAAKFGKQPKEEPPLEGGQLPNMPPPVETPGDDRYTQ